METKKLSNFLLLSIVLLLSGLKTTAQISGKITDPDGQPVPYASVQFLNSADSAFAGGILSGPDGQFVMSLKSGNYLLQISSLGFETFGLEISIPAGKDEVNLETIILKEVTNNLDAVIVRARRPVFDKKPDRISIHVSGLAGAGSTVLQILAKSPGVLVNRQSGNIEINGKKGILFMIDGKVNRLPPDALIQMLDGMNSENVDKIEIITSPPARYEATGDAGIVNIILKSNIDNGINGNVSATAGYQRGPIYGTNFRLQQKNHRLISFLNYSLRSVQTINYWKFNSEFLSDNSIFFDRNESKRKPITHLHDIKTGVDYQVTKTTNATLFLSAYRRNWDMNARTISRFGELGHFQETFMKVSEVNRWQSLTGNLEVSQKISDKHSLALSLDYLYYINNNPSSYSALPGESSPLVPIQLFMEVKKFTPIYYKIGSIDYSFQPNDQLSMEAGIKVAFSEFLNKVSVLKYESETSFVNDITANASLDERIYASYISSDWKMNQKLHLTAGLRYEYTISEFNREIEQHFKRSFGNFFPSISVTYDQDQKWKLHLSYNRRITRPTFNDMAPFVFYIGPRTYVSGNLGLKPALTDAFDFSWNKRQLWLTLRYGNSRNEIAQFQPERDESTDEIILSAENVDNLKILSVQTTFPLKVIRGWTFQNDLSMYYYLLSTFVDGIHISQNLKAITYTMVHSFDLSQMLKAEVALSYQSGSFLGISKYRSSGFVNLELKKQFKNGSVLSLMANDLFNTTQWRISTYSGNLNFKSDWAYDWGGRSISLSFSLPFGNLSMTDPDIKPRSEAERSRVN